jgi:Cof subfamily protein (haloacid dehalogenase superfamily)
MEVARNQYRMLALDVDGTLLDRDGQLRPRTAAAVARVADAGIRPILCTGRRYRRALPIALELDLGAPIVCNSGAIIKCPRDHSTLWRADFEASLDRAVLELFAVHDQPAVVFTDRDPAQFDLIVPAFPTGRTHFDDYVARNRANAQIDSSWRWRMPSSLASEADNDRLFHICAIGTFNEMKAFERHVLEQLGGRVQTFVQRTTRYLGTMCEVLRQDASKWTAILHLAQSWGIDPSEICAVGDDDNDIPMIRHAGLGVAMGHAADDVRTAADLVTGNHDEDGVAMLVDQVLLA